MAKNQITLTDSQVKEAAKMGHLTLRDYLKRGGVADLMRKVEEKKQGLSSYIVQLAHDSAELGKSDAKVTAAYFRAMCVAAETAIKTEAKVENVKDAVPVWPVFKSNIVRAIEAGVDVKACKTESAIRNAYAKKKEAEAAAAERAARPTDGTGDVTSEGGEAAAKSGATLAPFKGTAKLAAVLQVLGALMPKLDAEAQDRLAERLAEIVAEFQPGEATADESDESDEEEATEAAA